MVVLTTRPETKICSRYHTIIRPCRSSMVQGSSTSPKFGLTKNFASLASSAKLSPSMQGRVFLTRSAKRVTSHSVLSATKNQQSSSIILHMYHLQGLATANATTKAMRQNSSLATGAPGRTPKEFVDLINCLQFACILNLE